MDNFEWEIRLHQQTVRNLLCWYKSTIEANGSNIARQGKRQTNG